MSAGTQAREAEPCVASRTVVAGTATGQASWPSLTTAQTGWRTGGGHAADPAPEWTGGRLGRRQVGRFNQARRRRVSSTAPITRQRRRTVVRVILLEVESASHGALLATGRR